MPWRAARDSTERWYAEAGTWTPDGWNTLRVEVDHVAYVANAL